MYSRFGPCSDLYAASAWSMSKRKSWRPWMSSVGVLIVGSFASGERVLASAAAAVRSLLAARPADAASSCGSHRLVGTSPARYWTSPDFESPCGASEVSRFVHVMTGTAALNGTPFVNAFQTAPPPSEMPSAPMFVSPSCPANQLKSSCVSCTSRAPSRPKRPSEVPCPRASHSSVSYPAGAKKLSAAGSMSWWRPPRPWKRITPGRGEVAGSPGVTVEHASFAPSDIVRVSCVTCGGVVACAPDAHARASADTTRTLPNTGDRVALLYDHRHGHAAHRGVRLGCGRAHRSARVPRHDAARGFRLPRRPCAPAVWPASARRGARVCTRDRPLSRGAGREADRRCVQHRNLCRVAAVAGAAHGARDRRADTGIARRRAGDPQPEDRLACYAGHRRLWPLRGARACARRRGRARRSCLPASCAVDRERRSVRRAN